MLGITGDPDFLPWGDFYPEVVMDLTNNQIGRAAGEAGVLPPSLDLVFGTGGPTGQPDVGASDYLGSLMGRTLSPMLTVDVGVTNPAAGGFVLYPSRPNLNQTSSIYAK